MRKRIIFAMLSAAAFGLTAPAGAQDRIGPFTGFIDVRRVSPYHFLAGEERKFHSGEQVAVTIQGTITWHRTKPERRCTVVIFCKTVQVPDPESYGFSRFPPQLSWRVSHGNVAVPSARSVGSMDATIELPLTDPQSFDSVFKLVGFVPVYLRRGDSTGGYDIRVTVDNTARRNSFASYLAVRARSALELREQDVLDIKASISIFLFSIDGVERE